MSIVGTRPPTLDEWNKYELHHRARLVSGWTCGKSGTDRNSRICINEVER